MKNKTLFVLILSLTIVAVVNAQNNETRWGFELNGGASLATGKPGNTSLNPGFGFEGVFIYRFLPHTGIYAGWGWNQFTADASFAGNDVSFEETGYVLGLQFKHPVGHSSLAYYFRAGGLYNHIEIENKAGDIIGDSGHGLGFQLAGGIDYSLGKNWSITPGLKFNYLSRDIELEGTTTHLNHNYLMLRIGIIKNF